jgi:CRISPR/Cas system CMR-associated protein Cmr3 (group 5 of RAMP superfamily)
MENSRQAEADRLLLTLFKQYESDQFESALAFVYEFSDLLDDEKGEDFSLFGV